MQEKKCSVAVIYYVNIQTEKPTEELKNKCNLI